jgi:sulfatase modifying factor 1
MKSLARSIVALAVFTACYSNIMCQADSTGVPAKVDTNRSKISNSIGMELIRIRAGKFLMGSPLNEEGRYDDECQHEVNLSRDFYLGAYDVTVADFSKFVSDTGYRTEAERAHERNTWKHPKFPQNDNYPVVMVSWNDAVAFCEWLTTKEGSHYRLPTEAEWEYTCRAGTKTRFNLGDAKEALDSAGWYNDPKNEAHEVGQKRANAWGLYDMHGNVWQWCSDRYGPYPVGPVTDPHGPEKGDERVCRGGSWMSVPPRNCRSALRGHGLPSARDGDGGFRVVRD